MRFYFMPYSSSLAPQVALAMAGVDYEAVKVDLGKIKSPEFLQLNPQGQVPVLIDEDLVLTHNWAIIHYLDKKFPNAKIFGTDLKTQALAAKWLSFANADLHKAFIPLFRVPECIVIEKDALIDNAKNQVISLYQIVNEALNKQKFIAGDEFTIADAYLYTTMQWAKKLELDLSSCPNFDNYCQKVEDISAVKKALAFQ